MYYCRCGRLHKDSDGPEADLEFRYWSDSEEEDMDPVKRAVKDGNVNKFISALAKELGDKKFVRANRDYPFTRYVKYALKWCCRFNKLNCVEDLFARVDLLSQDNGFCNSPLHVACADGNVKVVKYLIKLAKERNLVDNVLEAVDMLSQTPLHKGASSCEIIALLLNQGADPCKRAGFKNKVPYEDVERGTQARKMLKLAYKKGRLVPTFSKQSED